MNHPEIEAGQKYKDDDGEYDILKIWEDEQRGLLVAFFDTTDHLDAYKEAVIVARKHEKKNTHPLILIQEEFKQNTAIKPPRP